MADLEDPVPVCFLDDIVPGTGVCARLDGEPIAVFRTEDDVLFAVGNVDPFTGAGVLSRGLLGEHQGTVTVASPLGKQRFCLRTGRCLDDPAAKIPVYEVLCLGRAVLLRRPGNTAATNISHRRNETFSMLET